MFYTCLYQLQQQPVLTLGRCFLALCVLLPLLLLLLPLLACYVAVYLTARYCGKGMPSTAPCSGSRASRCLLHLDQETPVFGRRLQNAKKQLQHVPGSYHDATPAVTEWQCHP
jgi:hypothetical protein